MKDEKFLALDTEEFNGICYAYRTAPLADPPEVIKRYHAVLKHVQQLLDWQSERLHIEFEQELDAYAHENR